MSRKSLPANTVTQSAVLQLQQEFPGPYDKITGEPLVGPGVCWWCKQEVSQRRLTVLRDRVCIKSNQKECQRQNWIRLTMTGTRPKSWYYRLETPGAEGHKEVVRECRQNGISPNEILEAWGSEVFFNEDAEEEFFEAEAEQDGDPFEWSEDETPVAFSPDEYDWDEDAEEEEFG